MQDFLLENALLKSLRINVSLNYSSTYYVAPPCARRCSDVLLHVRTQPHSRPQPRKLYRISAMAHG